MFNLRDTITAICTPPGIGGIAAIRISGTDSWSIIKKIFCKKDLIQLQLEHMHAVYGSIKSNGKIIDEVIILPFKSPKSFTTEDVIEIYCHGGNKIPSMILDLCLQHGARRASGGEFTFRAFINGRIDLIEAEAIHEVIHADTVSAVYASSEILRGSLKDKVNNFREKLFGLITIMEGSIEFPLDVPGIEKKEIVLQLTSIQSKLHELIKHSESGQILQSGMRVAIIGAPNVGKSSLLNQLLENERAIVTREAGTTRDTIEEKAVIGGYPFVFVDTAGIRNNVSISESEKQGIDRSKFAIYNSDIVLLVIDLSKNPDKESEEIFNILNEKSKIVIGNKVDLISKPKANSQQLIADVCVSAKYGTNIDKLKRALTERLQTAFKESYAENVLYINQRQKELLLQCSSSVDVTAKLVAQNESEDLITDELKKAVSKLDEISGKKINDDVINNIFAKFCVGK